MGSLACRSYAQRDVGRTIGELRLCQRQYTVAIDCLAKLQHPCNQMTSYLTHNLLLCFSRACSRRAAQWCTTDTRRASTRALCHRLERRGMSLLYVGLSQLKGELDSKHITVENCEREAQAQILDEHTKT